MDRSTEAGPAGAGARSAVPDDAPSPGPGRSTLVVLLVALAVVGAALAGPFDPQFRQVAEPLEPEMPTVSPTPEEPLNPFLDQLDRGNREPLDLTWVGLVLLTVVFLAAVWGLARLLRRIESRRRRRSAPDDAGLDAAGIVGAPGAMPDLPALRDGVADAGGHLRTEQAPADAVIAAWVALEGAAGRSGVVRDRAQTPTEFTLQVLDRTPADREATRTLLRLYLLARFGPDPLTAADVAEASDAVAVLSRTLADDA